MPAISSLLMAASVAVGAGSAAASHKQAKEAASSQKDAEAEAKRREEMAAIAAKEAAKDSTEGVVEIGGGEDVAQTRSASRRKRLEVARTKPAGGTGLSIGGS